MKAKVLKTEFGWEPAYWYDGIWNIDPGFAKTTRREAQAALDADLDQCLAIDAQQRIYAAGMDYACGYRD